METRETLARQVQRLFLKLQAKDSALAVLNGLPYKLFLEKKKKSLTQFTNFRHLC